MLQVDSIRSLIAYPYKIVEEIARYLRWLDFLDAGTGIMAKCLRVFGSGLRKCGRIKGESLII